MARWSQEVWDRLMEGPATSEELGDILKCWGPDAVMRIKSRMPLTVVGKVPGRRRLLNLYALVQPRWSARHEGLVPMKTK